MKTSENDPGRPKAVTNAEEQDVVINHSMAEDGYDSPDSAAKENESGKPVASASDGKNSVRAIRTNQTNQTDNSAES
jgi:hypothetical protein